MQIIMQDGTMLRQAMSFEADADHLTIEFPKSVLPENRNMHVKKPWPLWLEIKPEESEATA